MTNGKTRKVITLVDLNTISKKEEHVKIDNGCWLIDIYEENNVKVTNGSHKYEWAQWSRNFKCII